ncbi:sulfatase-like hydrolase/transferase [Daejeonella sp.]|uniref:sulfatase-like hydrolase/transferase n=1 Tax=Daejeonella sp. TaxID=2805397 RepID=UPI0039834A46
MKLNLSKILHFIIWFASLAIPSVYAQESIPKAKNILVLYSDDQSYNTLGILGNKEIYTPNLDKLAQQGVFFTQAHVMGGHQGAVCIPSRVMMLSGRYLNRLPKDGAVIPDSIITLPEVLQQKGYTTFHTGKWHSDKISHNRIFKTGNNIFFGGMHFPDGGGQEHPAVFKYDASGEYGISNKILSNTFSSELYADAAVEFLTSAKAKADPFYCYVAFTSPHDPRTPPKKYRDMYKAEKISLPPNFLTQHPFDNGDLNVRDEKLITHPRTEADVKREIALYYGMVSEMDAQVGRILQALDKAGLRENTVIVFAGDNGLAVGQHGLVGKQNLYEHSIRVPMIISGPGIKKNVKTDAFAYLSDISPTLYDYLNIIPPATVEAKSLLPILYNPETSVRASMYNVYGHWSRSIKTRDGFKMILYNVKGKLTTQLFNLIDDPWEMKNLAWNPKYSGKLTELRNLLKREMSAAHDDLNIDLPDWGRKPNQKSYGS